MALAPGTNAGPYRIVEPLGRGGMASVYRAYEPKLDRYVALKVLPREFLHDPNFAQRFREEARLVAKLEHPNIIPIYRVGRTGRTSYFVMKYLRGRTLASVLHARGTLPPSEIRDILATGAWKAHVGRKAVVT